MRYLIVLLVIALPLPAEAGLLFGPNIRTTVVNVGGAPAYAPSAVYYSAPVVTTYEPSVAVVGVASTHSQHYVNRHTRKAAKYAQKSANHVAKAAQ